MNNNISSLKDSKGILRHWDTGLDTVMVDYYQNLFTVEATSWNEVLDCVVPTVRNKHNEELLRPILDQEVKEAVFQMHPDKSSGPDRMNPKFYQKYWSIVGNDVINTHYLKRKQVDKDGFMALKFDLSKAYDRVDWHFLCARLTRMGFADKWVRLIFGCLASVKYQIVSSGRTMGPIVPSRGLREGDPISPYLFLVCTEAFSVLIRKYEERKWLHGCKVANGAPSISHMLFADDSFLYCKATREEVNRVQQLLDSFATATGQHVNFGKSFVFFSTNTSSTMRLSICNRLGITEASEHNKYLGLPSIVGRNKNVIFGYLKDKVQKRIQS
uniref:Reverse transcriptase domain-containing protein n=1 Tax=Cannabis sativa TaxID=3483 RepID=A0A803Q5Q8_CANSA